MTVDKAVGWSLEVKYKVVNPVILEKTHFFWGETVFDRREKAREVSISAAIGRATRPRVKQAVENPLEIAEIDKMTPVLYGYYT